MKIKILADAFDYRPKLGGVATCAYELCKSLSQNPDIELRLIAPAWPGDREFDKHGFFKTVRIPLSKVAYRAIPRLIWTMVKQVLIWKPNVTLHFLWMPSGVASFFSWRLHLGAKSYFMLAHGVEVLDTDTGLKKKIRKKLSFIKSSVFKHSRSTFAVSRFTANLVSSQCHAPLNKIKVIGNGVDSIAFSPGCKPAAMLEKNHLSDQFIFLSVTRLHDYKGIDRAIASLRHVIPKNPNVVYMVCGEGPDRPRLEKIARHYRVHRNVVFTGPIRDSELVDYYRLSDCFILLSREDYKTPNLEGFGIVFLEAAGCEKPSIGGRSGGIPDAVLDGETGWLVDPQDDHEIGNAMQECISNAEERKKRGQNARARVLESYTWEKVAARVYEELNHSVRD